jgi:hypothetical protein
MESVSVRKWATQKYDMAEFNVKKLYGAEVKEQCRLKFQNDLQLCESYWMITRTYEGNHLPKWK